MSNQKRKILLIHPNFTPPVIYDRSSPYPTIISQPPMSLLCLTAVLEKEGYSVKIVDALVEGENTLDIVRKESKDAILVGISVMTVQVKEAIKISEVVKLNSKAPVVWGGCQPTLFPRQTCQDELVDFVVVGEGEYTLLELVRALEAEKSYRNIRGLVYKEEGIVKVNPRHVYLNMENLPTPAYHLVDMDPYLISISTSGKRERIGIIETSRGCPYRCAFCINVVTNNRRYRMKSAQKVLEEIGKMIEKYNVNTVAFRDDNFFVNKDRVKEICQGIIKRNYKVTLDASCRADCFRKGFLDERLLPLMKKSGWIGFRIGAESGSPRILELIKKDITVDQTIFSAEMCRKYRILPTYSFIVGFPGETRKDMLMTIKLIKKIKKVNPDASIGVGSFRPYPGSNLYDSCVKLGYFKEPKTLRQWGDEEFFRVYTSEINENDMLWTNNPKFVINMCHYATLADKKIINILNSERYSILTRFGYAFIILLAKIRWKFGVFSFPYDEYLFKVFSTYQKPIKYKP